MPLGTFAPGEYVMNYAGAPVGLVTSGGQHLRYRVAKKPIDDTSSYGQTRIDGVYRGVGEVKLTTIFKEWNAAVRSAIWPYSNLGPGAAAQFDGTLGVIGRLDSNLAQPIVLTAVAGTPAAVQGVGPATFTALLAILSEANDVDVLFGPDERDIPVMFDLLLYDSGGVKRFFSVT